MRETLIRIPKATVIALLAILFGLAFIVTPYWTLPGSTPASIFLLTLTIAGGLVWLAVTGDETRIAYDPKKLMNVAIVLVVLLAIHYRSLTSAIAWRGDEHFHIENTLALVTHLSASGLIATFFVLGLIVFLTWRNPRWAIYVGAISIVFFIVFIFVRRPLGDISSIVLLRYPFLNYWFFALFPKFFAVISTPYQEFLYRLIPFLAMAGIVYFLQNSLALKEIYLNILWIAVFATIPILSYYAAILYLEPLAVFLMVLVCLRIRFLLEADFDQLKKDAGWYALIAVGFLKETALLFLACFLFVRLITRVSGRYRNNPGDYRFQSNKALKAEWLPGFLKDEIWVAVSVFLPLMIYLFFRFRFLETRTFTPHPEILADGRMYPILARSLFEQFGGVVFLFLAGLFLLLRRKEYPSASFFLLLVIAYPLFHAIDNRNFVGYSRFNLFLVPPILAGTAFFIKGILSQRKTLGVFLALALVALNLWSSPLLADGTRKSHWGIYYSGITEEYYPYPEAIAWLAQEHRNDKLLIAGFNYPYPFAFYFAKHQWKPSYRTLMVYDVVDERETLADAVEKAELRGSTLILFHVLEDQAALPPQMGEFQRVRTFRTFNNTIVIYRKDGFTP